MKSIRSHLMKCLLAGIVALLPVGGTVLMILYLENQLADTWLRDQPFYRFGMGLLLGFLIIYGVGLILSTFLGRWLWAQSDKLMARLPLLGSLYQTLKQLLGYGDGPDAIFKRVVMVRCEDLPGEQIGFVTSEIIPAGMEVGSLRLGVFIPAAPNPATGRLVYMSADDVKALDVSVNEAMKAVVSVGAFSLTSVSSEG